MVVILKDGVAESSLVEIVEYLDAYNVKVSVTKGAHTTILGLVGDTSSVDQDAILALPFVEDVKRIQEPYKAAPDTPVYLSVPTTYRQNTRIHRPLS